MKSNFEFLNKYWPVLAQIGAAAESYVYSDPNACLYKLGMFGERLILEIFAFEHIKEPTIDNTHANRTMRLSSRSRKKKSLRSLSRSRQYLLQHRPRHPRNVQKRVKLRPRAWNFPRLKPAI